MSRAELELLALFVLGGLLVIGSIGLLLRRRSRRAAGILRELAESRGWRFGKPPGVFPDPPYTVEAETSRPPLSIAWWPARSVTPGVTRVIAHFSACRYFRLARRGRGVRRPARGNVRLDDPAYHRAFSVEATDPTWLSKILTSEIRTRHLAHPVGLVVAGSDLIATRLGLPRDAQELAGIVDLVLQLGQRIEPCTSADSGRVANGPAPASSQPSGDSELQTIEAHHTHRRLGTASAGRASAIFASFLTAVLALGFGVGALFIRDEVPSRDELIPASGVVSQVKRNFAYPGSKSVYFWMDGREFYSSGPWRHGPLDANIPVGARVDALVFRHRPDEETLRVYELWAGGVKLQDYDHRVTVTRWVSMLCLAVSVLSLCAGAYIAVTVLRHRERPADGSMPSAA
jgi:hypothetical protein